MMEKMIDTGMTLLIWWVVLLIAREMLWRVL